MSKACNDSDDYTTRITKLLDQGIEVALSTFDTERNLIWQPSARLPNTRV